MPKRTYTLEHIHDLINKGEVKSEEICPIRVSFTYGQLADLMELREKLGKSTSELIRDALIEYKRKITKMEAPPSMDVNTLREELKQEQEKLRETLLSALKEIRTQEGSSPNTESLHPRIIVFLEDFGPLTTKNLAKYVGVDWRDIDRVCGEMQVNKVITRDGSKWRLV
jgi:hypothetical protein